MNIGKFCTFLLLAIPLSLFGKEHNLDSLYTVLKTEKEDTNKVKTMTVIGWKLADMGKVALADSFSRKALAMAQQMNFDRGIALAYKDIANVYWGISKYPEAIEYFTKSLKIGEAIGDKDIMAAAYTNIGDIYNLESNYPEALTNHLASLKIAEEVHDTIGIAICLANIGNIYFQQNNYEAALKQYRQSFEINKKEGNRYGMAMVYENMGGIYSELKNYDEALKDLNESLKMCRDIGNQFDEVRILTAIGEIYALQSKFQEAMQYYYESLEMAKRIKSNRDICSAYLDIADALTHTKQYPEAAKYLDSTLNASKGVDAKDIKATIYQNYAVLDSSMGNLKKAYDDYKTFVLYRDSLNNDASTKKLVQEQMQYEFDKKQAAEKAEQDKKDTIAKADRHKQVIITSSISVVLFLVLAFSGLLFSRYKVTQNQKKIIEEQKLTVEEKNKEVLDSIIYAKRLQDAILPPIESIKNLFPESFVLYKPKDIVAGDFYWLAQTADTILIAAADCTGHGVPGAMVSVVCSNALNRTVKEFHLTNPGRILDKTRELVLETFEKSEHDNIKDGMDISIAALNRSGGRLQLQWSGAYNPLWYVENGEMKEIAGDKQPIGKTDKPRPFTTHTISLNPPSEGNSEAVFYLFTDGYADQFGGPKGKKLKYKQLQEILLTHASKNMKEQGKALEEAFETWKGNMEQTDDVCIIGIRV